MKSLIYEIPGKLQGHHIPNQRVMIDTWTSLHVKKEEFESTIFDQGIPFGYQNGVNAWIVDTSRSSGVFNKEVQGFIDSDVAPTMARKGIKFFFVVTPESALARMTAKNVLKLNDKQIGMQTIEVGSQQEALDMLGKLVKI